MSAEQSDRQLTDVSRKLRAPIRQKKLLSFRMNQEGVLACCAVCNKETQSRCGQCLNTYYCNKEHQREDWKRHKNECLPKLVKQSTKKGTKLDFPTDCIVQTSKKVDGKLKDSHKNPLATEGSKENNRKKCGKSKKKSDRKGSPILENCKQTSGFLIEEPSIDSGIVNHHVEPSSSTPNSVISSVVCQNKDTTKLSAITYEGSSEKEIYSESAQQLSTAGFMRPVDPSESELKCANKSGGDKMAVMPGIVPRMAHREYPEAALRGSSVTNSYHLDSSDPCYEICQRVIRDMSTYGVCVIDNFLGKERGLSVRNEVLNMYRAGIFTAGQLVSDPGGTGAQAVRSDRITWIDGREPHCHNIGNLINQVDSIILAANKMPNNGKMGDYNINTRTKGMVACYPGFGSNYVKHVDNPNKDGRCITAIYYLNLDWDVRKNGGLLRVFPEGTDQVANIEPIFDRMLFFWSDRRNPHEVQPAFDTRYAITLWYFDAQERQEALRLYKNRGNRPTSSK